MNKMLTKVRIQGLAAGFLFLAVAAALATAAAGSGAGLLDGGGFPTVTPTTTLTPTLEPTQTPTVIPLESIFPAETSTPVIPYPVGQSLGAEALEPQASTAGGSSSPSLVLVALPFLGAFLLLALIVGNWLRRARG